MKTSRLALVAAAAVVATACARRSTTAPAVAAPGRSLKPGKFVWHDLVTESPDACRRFYGSLLGWEFDETRRLGKPYTIARIGAQKVAGIGMDVNSGGPAWGPFTGGVMYGAPAWN